MSVVLALLVILALAAAGAWDVYVIFIAPDRDTVSLVLSEWAVRFPLLPLAVGLLIGHLFWPVSPREKGK